jgi:glycosyltransferase involved in cell wall biosynthesis
LKRNAIVRFAGETIERLLLRHADKVIAKTESVAQVYSSLYPGISPDKFLVLYGGIEWAVYDSIEACVRTDRFTICHTGILYEDSVDPEPFFRAVRELTDEGLQIEVLFLGEKAGAIEGLIQSYHLQDQMRTLGHKPYLEAAAYQKAADLLLAFSCLTPYKILSKLAQYVAARKPLLVITELDVDPSGAFVEDNRRGLSVENSPEVIKDAILLIHGLWQEGSLGSRFDLVLRESVSFDYLVSRISDCLGVGHPGWKRLQTFPRKPGLSAHRQDHEFEFACG